MNIQFGHVREFMRAMRQASPPLPTLPHPALRSARRNMLVEEAQELEDATEYEDYVDAVVDTLYVALGAAVEAGLDADTLALCFQEVHRANMSKFWTTDQAAKDTTVVVECVGDDKWIAKRDGKVVKPDTFQPPDILSILKARYPRA